MNVVSIDPREKEETRRKQDMLEVIDFMRKQIEDGDIKEFVATSLNKDGDVQVHASCLDLPGGVGLYEIGKQIFIDQGTR
jgi:hypothetical protein